VGLRGAHALGSFRPLFGGILALFLAVALLLLASLLEAKPGLIRLQGLLLLGLLPLQLALFEGIAPLSLLLNLLALPLFCIGIIPLALIGVLLAPLSRSWPTCCSGWPMSACSGCCGRWPGWPASGSSGGRCRAG
jgi:predicted membrane metal-binding protein